MLGPATEAGGHHDTKIFKVRNGRPLLVGKAVKWRVAGQLGIIAAGTAPEAQSGQIGGCIRRSVCHGGEEQRPKCN
jgi:hypothetical protein